MRFAIRAKRPIINVRIEKCGNRKQLPKKDKNLELCLRKQKLSSAVPM